MKGEGLVPVVGGLKNAGQTCFANAALQVLLRLPAVALWLSHHADVCGEGLCLLCEVWRSRTAFGRASSEVPALVGALHRFEPLVAFADGAQHDAEEFLAELLAAMSASGVRAGCSVAWPGVGTVAGQATHVERLFGFLLEQRMRCEDCGDAAGVRSRCDAHCVLHLPPPPEEDRARVWTTTELYFLSCAGACVEGDDVVECVRCGRRTRHRSQERVLTQPNVLVLHPRRHGRDDLRRVLRHAVQPELELTLPGHDRYELAAVLYHRGPRAGAGHYYCVVRAHDGRWWRLGDSQARVFRGELGHSELRCVHLMVYTRSRGQARFAQMGALLRTSGGAQPDATPAPAAPTGPVPEERSCAGSKAHAAVCATAGGAALRPAGQGSSLGGGSLPRRGKPAPKAAVVQPKLQKGRLLSGRLARAAKLPGQSRIGAYLLGRRLWLADRGRRSNVARGPAPVGATASAAPPPRAVRGQRSLASRGRRRVPAAEPPEAAPKTPVLSVAGAAAPAEELSPSGAMIDALIESLGLSPLARGQGGAATPSGDAASVPDAAPSFAGLATSLLKRRRADDLGAGGSGDEALPLSVQQESQAQLLLDSLGHVRSPAGARGALHAKDVGGGGWCFFKAFADQLGSDVVRGFRALAALALVEVVRRRAEFAHTVPGSLFALAEPPEVQAARRALKASHRCYAGIAEALSPFEAMVLDKFEGVLRGDLRDARRYAEMYEMLALVQSCGLELLLVEGADVPGAPAMRTRVYPSEEGLESAVPRLRGGCVDLVFVRYEAGSWQHYRSVCFADGRPWRLAEAARRRVEGRLSACDICAAVSRGRRDEARALMLSLVGPCAVNVL